MFDSKMFDASLIAVGDDAPTFQAALSDGTSFALASERGKRRIVLVFYPGDNTPVCTAQLCALRDVWNDFQLEDTVVIGVNPASAGSHSRFVEKYAFPFPLIVDTHGRIAKMYGCRVMFGLIRRTVYVVDRLGKIGYAQRGNPSSKEIVNAIRNLHDDFTETNK